MTPRLLRAGLLLSSLLLATSLPAQTVRVVDPTGGGQYVSLYAAVAASLPGDTILIRRGGSWNYVNITIPLRIVAEPPEPTIAILHFTFVTRPTLPVVVTGIDAAFVIVSGGGNVVFEDVQAGSILCTDTTSLLFENSSCSGIQVLDPTYAALQLQNANAVVVDSTLVGQTGRCQWTPSGTILRDGTPAISIEDGTLLVAGSTLTGGTGNTLSCGVTAPAPAIRGRRGSVALTRSSLVGGANGPLVAVELDSASTLATDPSTVFTGVTTPMPTVRVLAMLRGSGAAAGLPASLLLLAPPQTVALLAVADQAGGPTNTPFGSLWLDPYGYFVTVRSGITDLNGQLAFSYRMPPVIVGTPLYFQGFALPPADLPGLTVPRAVVSR